MPTPRPRAELLGDGGIETTLLPRREDDPMQRRPDITLAKEVLDWEPTVPLREGLAKIVQQFFCKMRFGCWW